MVGGRVARGGSTGDRADAVVRASRGSRRALTVLFGFALLAGCTARDPDAALDTRMWTDDLAFRIRLTPRPPYAREDVIVKVVIADAKGKTLVDATSAGPWFLVKLPAGSYQIVATFAGKDVKRPITLGTAKLQTVDFRWATE